MRLDALRAQPGLIAAVLVGPDGLPLEMIGEGEAFAAELAALRAWTARVGERMGAGRVTRLALTTEQLEVIALASGPFVLGAALTRGLDTRPAQQALAALASKLAALPDPADESGPEQP